MAESRKEKSKIPGPRTKPMRRLKFLVAEDNEADVTWLKIVLDEMDLPYTMSVVTDGEQAQDAMLKRGTYLTAPEMDLIFLDLNLPKLTGVEVLERVPGFSSLPLCIVTGSETERDVLTRRFGIRRIAYLIKPVDRVKILNCFRVYSHLRPYAEALSS